jgi:hypothetical protein
VLTDFIDDWIGFSERYDGAPVAHQSVLTRNSADISKRDAIVAAFKVGGVDRRRNYLAESAFGSTRGMHMVRPSIDIL